MYVLLAKIASSLRRRADLYKSLSRSGAISVRSDRTVLVFLVKALSLKDITVC